MIPRIIIEFRAGLENPPHCYLEADSDEDTERLSAWLDQFSREKTEPVDTKTEKAA